MESPAGDGTDLVDEAGGGRLPWPPLLFSSSSRKNSGVGS